MTDEELIARLRDNAQKAHEVALHAWGSDFLQGLGAEARIESVAADRLQSLLTQNQKMREALEPFVAVGIAFLWQTGYRDDEVWYARYGDVAVKITYGDLRRAAALGDTPASSADEAEPLPKATI